MKLYEFHQSRSTRVRWLLAELELEYESVNVDLVRGEQFSDDFLAINPCGKVPVLVDQDNVITESAAICTWLAEKFPERNLIPPEGSVERGHYYQWCFFCLAELEPYLWNIRRHMIIYPREKRSLAAIELAKEEYDNNVRNLARHIESAEYIVNNTFTVADIIIGYNLLWADTLKLLEGFTELSRYLERLKARPAFPRDIFD